MTADFSLLSFRFLTLAVMAVVLLTLLGGKARQLAFLAVNLIFLNFVLLGPSGTLSTLSFCLLGYLLVLGLRIFSGWIFVAVLAGFVLVFTYMRNYDFLNWILPDTWQTQVLATAGLSFMFFKIVHVVIEVRSATAPPVDFPTFLNYCLNFTSFAMGPIQRYQDYRAQWLGEKPAIAPTFEAHLDAVLRVLVGLVKAYVLARFFAPFTLPAGSGLAGLSMIQLLIGGYAFYAFLYLSFSGYCDVVIGVGSLMGVRPPENFDKPFLARNVSDFWLRVHRSLTLWLTDYVFTPLYKRMLSSKVFRVRPLLAANISVMVTMMVSGLWHGTTLSFFLFGVVHGLYLVIYRHWDSWLLRKFGRSRVSELRKHPLAVAAGIFVTFNAVSLAYLFFRLDSVKAIRDIMGAM